MSETIFDKFQTVLKGKIILLTGGAGFIGSHIAEAVLGLGVSKLIIVDNLSTGNLDNLKITGVLADKRVIFHQEDIGDIGVLRKIMEKEPDIDIICHQAALGSVPRSVQNPLASHKTNVDGFFNMLDTARLYGIKRFVYASSSSVYGDSITLPKVEEGVGEVISPYAATKKINEIYANVFSRCYDMECIGLRYFNVFGPRQSVNGPYAAVIPRFADAVKENVRPIIYGTGEQSRDFTYVENAVNANILAMIVPSVNNKTKSPVFGRVYNVASGGRVTLNEMYAVIKNITGTTLEPIYEESRKGDIEHSWASIEKATRMLGYYPTVSFIDGLKITLQYYLNRVLI
jgi:UDP-N-acetylglucosamine 4-epimerase